MELEASLAMNTQTYRAHRYEWEGTKLRQVPTTVCAESLEGAARALAGDGLTLVECPKIVSLGHLVAKVWNGSGYAYVYRFPG